jgi:hypothetical protein
MRFRTGDYPRTSTDATLVYRPDDFAFDIEPPQDGFTSVVVNDLSLEVDPSGKLIKVWGYCPHVSWIKSKVAPPTAAALELFAISDEPFLPGVSQRVNTDERWPVMVDQQSGWVCLDSGRSATTCIQILSGAILCLDCDQKLTAVYLKPARLPKLP